MYNEYPDLILEGLTYDLNIVTEADTENKNIFQKFIAFLKRIGQWFVKIFKKITEKIKGIKSSNDELTDEVLSKIKVTNYDIPMIENFINCYESILKKITDIIITRSKLEDSSYENNDYAEEYITQIDDLCSDAKNSIVVSELERNKFINSFEDRTDCNKKIYDFMVNTFKNIQKSNINEIAYSYSKKFKSLAISANHTKNVSKTVTVVYNNDRKIINICTNVMQISAKILSQIFADLHIIYNGVKNSVQDKVYTPSSLSVRGNI